MEYTSIMGTIKVYRANYTHDIIKLRKIFIQQQIICKLQFSYFYETQ